MTSDFDELETMIMADARKVYSEAVIDHATNPRNVGNLADADGFGHVKGPCGDTIEMWLKVRDDIIANATFWTDGCGPSIACGSMVTEIARGKKIAEARNISQADVMEALDGLPEDHRHCALLAANTLKEAVNDYVTLKKEPWKKGYRNR